MKLAYPFDAFVFASGETLGYLCSVTLHDQFLSPDASIQAYRNGVPVIEELFDGVDIIVPISTPIIKYGHLNSLGVPLLFPETGQVALDMKQGLSLESVLELLGKPHDFKSGLTSFQIDYLEAMRKAFPGKRVHWGWQWEGPVTTLWGLTGNDCMYGVYDDPELFEQCMEAIVSSLIEYAKFYCRIDGTSVLDPFPDHGRICDDIAAMFSPDIWKEFVLPYWKRYWREAPVPEIKLHCEDMKEKHLRLLDGLSITDYDPGISPYINPEIIRKSTSTPFCWRLGSFLYPQMSEDQCYDFAVQAAIDGACYTFTAIEPMMCEAGIVKKIKSYYKGAQDVRKALLNGCSRLGLKKLLHCAYPEGYWETWEGFRK